MLGELVDAVSAGGELGTDVGSVGTVVGLEIAVVSVGVDGAGGTVAAGGGGGGVSAGGGAAGTLSGGGGAETAASSDTDGHLSFD